MSRSKSAPPPAPPLKGRGAEPELRKNLQSPGSARPVKTSFSSFNEATASPQEDKTTFSSSESKPIKSHFLRNSGLAQDKSLGQHWLIDELVLDNIALSLSEVSCNSVLEIGPGKGALTSYLLKKIDGGHLFVVEFDERMSEHLKKQYLGNKNITVINQDYLKFSEQDYFEGDYVIIANLPYNISSPIFNKLITTKLKPVAAALLVQKEVASRLSSAAGERNSSPLSIELNNYYQTELGIIVPKEAFDPPPKVTSQIIKLKLREETVFGENLAGVMKLVRLGFKMRRKKLINNLASLNISNQNLSLILTELNIETSIRAEQMTNGQWLELYLYFKDRGVLK